MGDCTRDRRRFLSRCALPIGAGLATGWLGPIVAADPSASPQRITPGKAIVPMDKAMRRHWGELISLDLATRTGTFRREGNDEVIAFTVLPYAELLHHAAFGDLQDFRVGERAIFRLHENEAGQWTWLTYIQDEMNFLFGHKEYYHVDRIDAPAGILETTDANADKSYVRTKGIILNTDNETRYWKKGAPAKFADIQVGDKLRTKTHGAGKGTTRVCWEVFIDDESLLKFQSEQREIHARRMKDEGLPCYIDSRDGVKIQMTFFRETSPVIGQFKSGAAFRISLAGVDRRPIGKPIGGQLFSIKGVSGGLSQATAVLDTPDESLAPLLLARVWPTP